MPRARRKDLTGSRSPRPRRHRETDSGAFGRCLCAEAGMSPAVVENQAAYIQGWLTRLRSEKRLIVIAAAKARKAADYILGRSCITEKMRAAAEPKLGRLLQSSDRRHTPLDNRIPRACSAFAIAEVLRK